MPLPAAGANWRTGHGRPTNHGVPIAHSPTNHVGAQRNTDNTMEPPVPYLLPDLAAGICRFRAL